MKMKLDIYPEQKKLYKNQINKLQKLKTTPKNKELFNQFLDFVTSKGVKQRRITKIAWLLMGLCRYYKGDFHLLTRETATKLVADLNRVESYKEQTKADYRKNFKRFMLWYKDFDPRLDSDNREVRKEAKLLYKYLEKDMKCGCKVQKIDYNLVLKDSDIDKIIDKGCRSLKEKAFIKLLHETGARAGEFLNIRIKNIEFKDNKARVWVDGKTGQRPIPFVRSIGYLSNYLENHPFKDDPQSFLWVGENRKHINEPLLHKGGQKLIDRVFERAGYIQTEYFEGTSENGKKIKRVVKRTRLKPSNYHWFRHSRASLLAPKVPQTILCDFMGWEYDSDQPKRYVHLCPEDVENAYFKTQGIINQDKEEDIPLKCGCGEYNNKASRYCFKCGRPVSVDIALQDDELKHNETDKSIQLLMEIMKKPELLAKFEKFKRDIS